MANIFGGGGGGGFGVVQQPGQGNIVQTLVQTVKQDMEQMERGHQWPFGCYSPAKDCISVPGMDDISPEEMRLEAYQAMSSGSVPAYQQKMQELKNSYASKRQMLVNPTNEMKEIFRRIFNKETLAGMTSPLISGASSGTTSGLFSSAATPSRSVFGSGQVTGSSSVFGGGSSAAGGLFGARQTSSSIFGGSGSGSGLFGASGQSNPIFGGSGSSAFGSQPQNQSLFGAPAQQQQQQQQQQSSIFGSSSQQQQQQSGGSIFGGPAAVVGGLFGQKSATSSTFGGPATFGQPAATAMSTSAGSIFGSNSATTMSQTATSGLFGQTASIFGGQSPAASTSLFGQPATQQASIFGQPAAATSAFGSAAPPAGSIFGQQAPTAASTPFGSSSTSVFGQTSTFGHQPTATPTPLFGQPSPATTAFGQTPAFQPQGSSIFGQPASAANQQQQPQPASLFGQPTSTASPFAPTSAFATTTAASSTTMTTPFGNPAPNQSPFGMPSQTGQQPSTAATSGGLFGNRDTASASEASGGLFGSRPAAAGGGLFGEVIEPQRDSSMYTPIEKLTQEIIQIFQTGNFQLGKIPEVPPPEELCV